MSTESLTSVIPPHQLLWPGNRVFVRGVYVGYVTFTMRNFMGEPVYYTSNDTRVSHAEVVSFRAEAGDRGYQRRLKRLL